MEEFDRKGLWWLPQYPDHRVAGTLKFDPEDGAVLELIGDSFAKDVTELFAAQNVINTIWGSTEKGDSVTLQKCAQSGGRLATGYTSTNYRAQEVFIGCHFRDGEEDVVFDSIAI